MTLPSTKQPDAATIARELAFWDVWKAAYLTRENPLPEIPKAEDQSSTVTVLFGMLVRSPFVIAGWIARRMGLVWLRRRCARMRVRLDWMTLCRAGCSLNHAFTELGLAALQAGDVPGAIECLKRSWHVHPCAHDLSFGLHPGLWMALAGIPEAEATRSEYEQMARRFASHFGVPQRKMTLTEVARSIRANTKRRTPGDGRHGGIG